MAAHPENCPCRLCWLAKNDPRHAAGFAGHALATQAGGTYPPPPDPPAVPRVGVNACVHLGDVERGDTAPCVFRRHWCEHFGEPVTPMRCPHSARSCEGCGQYERRG
jgi:hypothetical protein